MKGDPDLHAPPPNDQTEVERRRGEFRREVLRILTLGVLVLLAGCGVCVAVLRTQ